MVSQTHTLAQARLKHQLEIQSRIIEETLRYYSGHQVQVIGGHVEPKSIRYEVSLSFPDLLPHTLQPELARRLGVTTWLVRERASLTVRVDRPSTSVSLLNLIESYQVSERGTPNALLGLTEDGRVAQLNLNEESHLLLAGMTASGKTSLLRTILLSLALGNDAKQLQFIIIQLPTDEGLGLPSSLPPAYLRYPTIADAASATTVLNDLAAGLTKSSIRRAGPKLVVILDGVDTLLAAGKSAALLPLVKLLASKGPYSLLLSTQQPHNHLFHYAGDTLSTRLVGRVANKAQAEAVTGLPHSRAEQLPGQGAFLQQRQSTLRYFQAAYADRYETSFLLSILHRRDRFITPHLPQPAAFVSELITPGALAFCL